MRLTPLAPLILALLAAPGAEATKARPPPTSSKQSAPQQGPGAAIDAATVSNYMGFSQDSRMPSARNLHGPQRLTALTATELFKFSIPACGISNTVAINRLINWLRTGPRNEYALALVPGTSERTGHHSAWVSAPIDSHWVEPEYRARLRQAYLLLREGIVHSLVLSGGSIDFNHQEYNEAVSGYREMIAAYAADFRRSAAAHGDTLQQRIIVDPYAFHSWTNPRNTDRLSLWLGLDRNLIVTTAGDNTQGWWYVNHDHVAHTWLTGSIRFVALDGISRSKLGYTLGSFGQLGGPTTSVFGTGESSRPVLPLVRNYRRLVRGAPADGAFISTMAIAHWNLNPETMRDPKWDVGANEHDGWPPDKSAIAAACGDPHRRPPAGTAPSSGNQAAGKRPASTSAAAKPTTAARSGARPSGAARPKTASQRPPKSAAHE